VSSLFDLPFEEPAQERQPVPQPRRILTVSELNARIRALLEARFADVWVEGELSNSRIWNTGHIYFTLKDAGAQIRGVMFRKELQALRFTPQDGLRVLARGRIAVYDPKGEYQIICEHLEPEGLGALQLAFDQLKARLAREGLFEAGRKRPLPALPRKIGIVTSLDGAAVRDIVKVLRRRYPNAHLVIRPARVQGEGAALDVARALRALGKVPAVDVVIVARGGGSIEDLWAFNEEVVARAIAGCPVPTISAVGHETDVTIADFVADVRAPTPSAAAEIVVARKDDFCAHLDRLALRVTATMRRRLLVGRHVGELGHALHRALQARLAARDRAYRTLRLTLETFDLRRRLGRVRTRLVAAEGRLAGASARVSHRAEGQLRAAAARLEALSPLAVLGRGYAVCWTGDRAAIVRDAAAVSRGDRLRVTLARGELDCDVVDCQLSVVTGTQTTDN
jgi:exodeoxyribonuclease VII large subunit